MQEATRKKAATAARALGAVAGAAMLVGVGYGAVLAFLTDEDGVTNSFTPVENEVEIVEDFRPPEELGWEMDIPKKVQVENTEAATCWVRVLAEFSDPDAAEHCTLDLDEGAWTPKQADGYYYLRSPLAPGETSSPLFTTIHVGAKPADDGKSGEWVDYPGAFDVVVVAESVGVEEFSTPQEAFAAHDGTTTTATA